MQLKPGWYIEPPIDAEHKLYVYMAFKKMVLTAFENYKLYPYLADVIILHQDAQNYINQYEGMQKVLPYRISGFSLTDAKIFREPEYEEPSLLEGINDFVRWAINDLYELLHLGKNVYNEILSYLKIQWNGIIPLNRLSGSIHYTDSAKDQYYYYEIIHIKDPKGNIAIRIIPDTLLYSSFIEVLSSRDFELESTVHPILCREIPLFIK